MHQITATLSYYDPVCPPRSWRWSEATQPQRPINTFTPDKHQVQVSDLRELSVEERAKAGFTLDQAGFETVEGWGEGEDAQKVAREWKERKWEDEKWIDEVYYPYAEKFFKEKFGASKVVFYYAYTFRQRTTPDEESSGKPGILTPATQTHIDHDPWSALERLRMNFGEDALARVQSGRARAIICNMWRPCIGPIVHRPLGMCDYRSIDNERDLEHTAPAPSGCRTGESQMFRYHPDQKWFYQSKLREDECVLLKIFDSQTGVRTPHCSFPDPSSPRDAPPNLSLEIRALSLIEL